jgi:hypothetical protein
MLSAGLPDASALMSAVRRETVGADGPDGGLA